jgi:hypothetical protein
VEFDFIDSYLLERQPSKADLIARILQKRSEEAAAAPFYRALEALGARVADEAIIALRLVLAGHAPSDERVKRLRDAAASFRAAGLEARAAKRAQYFKELT